MSLDRFFLVLSCLIISQVSSASELPLPLPPPPMQVGRVPSDAPKSLSENDAPVPVDRFKFEDLKAAYEGASLPSANMLPGRWELAGYATISVDFGIGNNCYSKSECANEDRSIRAMEFSLKNKFPTNETVLAAKFLNLGTKNSAQGPYEVSIDQNRKAAIVSSYAYTGDGLSKSYFTHSCRLLNNAEKILLCGITLNIRGDFKGSAAKYDKVMGGVAIYQPAIVLPY